MLCFGLYSKGYLLLQIDKNFNSNKVLDDKLAKLLELVRLESKTREKIPIKKRQQKN